MEDIIVGRTYIPVEKITEGAVKAKTPIAVPQAMADRIAAENKDYLDEIDVISKSLDYCNITHIAYNKSTKRLYVLSVIMDEKGTFPIVWLTEIDCSDMKVVSYEPLGTSNERCKDIEACGGWSNFKALLSDYYTKQNWKNQLKRRGKAK